MQTFTATKFVKKVNIKSKGQQIFMIYPIQKYAKKELGPYILHLATSGSCALHNGVI